MRAATARELLHVGELGVVEADEAASVGAQLPRADEEAVHAAVLAVPHADEHGNGGEVRVVKQQGVWGAALCAGDARDGSHALEHQLGVEVALRTQRNK